MSRIHVSRFVCLVFFDPTLIDYTRLTSKPTAEESSRVTSTERIFVCWISLSLSGTYFLACQFYLLEFEFGFDQFWKMPEKNPSRSLRSNSSPGIQLDKKSATILKQPVTLSDLNAALDAYAGKLDSSIDALLEKRLSSSIKKLRCEIRADLLEEINHLKTVIENQALEIAELKSQALIHSSVMTDLDTLAMVTHSQMRREIAPSVVISGLSEDSDVDDGDRIEEILCKLDCSSCEVIRHERVGRATTGRPRLLKVKFRPPSEKTKVVRNCRRLRNDSEYNGIYVNPDLTYAERHERRRLHTVMDNLKRQNINSNVSINKGVLYQDGLEVDRALPHRFLFRPQISSRP